MHTSKSEKIPQRPGGCAPIFAGRRVMCECVRVCARTSTAHAPCCGLAYSAMSQREMEVKHPQVIYLNCE